MALRNDFRVTKKFLIAKFDCTKKKGNLRSLICIDRNFVTLNTETRSNKKWGLHQVLFVDQLEASSIDISTLAPINGNSEILKHDNAQLYEFNFKFTNKYNSRNRRSPQLKVFINMWYISHVLRAIYREGTTGNQRQRFSYIPLFFGSVKQIGLVLFYKMNSSNLVLNNQICIAQ